jgi:hypothetical protein
VQVAAGTAVGYQQVGDAPLALLVVTIAPAADDPATASATPA